MITMLNTDSNRRQTVVLEKAWKYLQTEKKLTTADQQLVDNYGKNTFTNLAHYFHYLPELIAHDPLYLMLPSDEQPFKIHANTREIEVPSDFEKCGGVQSDNYSEIVTFIIDRYFDYKDLAEARIAVQWINEAANKEGVSFIDLIDLETYGDENKLRFGWPLTAEMTAAAGNLRFAVRFYTATEIDGTLEFNYILNTVPKSIVIKPTLSVDFTNVNVIKNNADISFFLNSVTRSQNPSYAIPSQVVFSDVPPSTAAILLAADNSLGLKANELKLEAEAYTSDGGDIIYDWYYIAPGYRPYVPYDETGAEAAWPTQRPSTKLYVKNDKYVEGSTNPEEKNQYIEFTGAWPKTKPDAKTLVLYVLNPVRKIKDNDDFSIETTYSEYKPNTWPVERPLGLNVWVKDTTVNPAVYKKYGQNEPWPVFVNNAQEKEELEEKVGKEVLTTLDITLYTYKTVLKFEDTNTDVTGQYFVRGTNQVLDFDNTKVINSVYTDAPANYCSILAPIPVKIEEGKDLPSHMFLTDKNNSLQIAINKDDANPQRFYNLYYSNTYFSDIENMPKADAQNGIVTTITEQVPVTNNDTIIKYAIPSKQFGYYAIQPVVKLNRVSDNKQVSNICYVSDMPGKPIGTMKINDKNPLDIKNGDNIPNISGTLDTNVLFEWIGGVNSKSIEINATGETGQNITLQVVPSIENGSKFNTGEITYKWTKTLEGITEEILEPGNEESDIKDIDFETGLLTIRALAPTTGRYNYDCVVYNTIHNETKESDRYTFTIV